MNINQINQDVRIIGVWVLKIGTGNFIDDYKPVGVYTDREELIKDRKKYTDQGLETSILETCIDY